MRSPGRPPVARREDRRRFWVAIAAGLSSEAAAVDAGVSPAVGVRWFREAGGMPPATLAPSSKPPSERYLSFAEREEIAVWRDLVARICQEPSKISNLRRVANFKCFQMLRVSMQQGPLGGRNLVAGRPAPLCPERGRSGERRK